MRGVPQLIELHPDDCRLAVEILNEAGRPPTQLEPGRWRTFDRSAIFQFEIPLRLPRIPPLGGAA